MQDQRFEGTFNSISANIRGIEGHFFLEKDLSSRKALACGLLKISAISGRS